MNCPQCGDVCCCLPEPPPTPPAAGRLAAACHDEAASSLSSLRTGEPEDARTEGYAPASEGPAWRDELSARLDRYRARRKPRPPRYPSLRLRFDPPLGAAAASSASRPAPGFETASNQALALDGSAEKSVPDEAQGARPVPSQTPAQASTNVATAMIGTAKILEFPRFTPPTTSPDELA